MIKPISLQLQDLESSQWMLNASQWIKIYLKVPNSSTILFCFIPVTVAVWAAVAWQTLGWSQRHISVQGYAFYCKESDFSWTYKQKFQTTEFGLSCRYSHILPSPTPATLGNLLALSTVFLTYSSLVILSLQLIPEMFTGHVSCSQKYLQSPLY